MKVKRWRRKAVDREGWAYVMKGGRALRGPLRRVVVGILHGQQTAPFILVFKDNG